MVSGIPFSDREKAFIIANAPTRTSWGALAADLVREFPADGNGSRDGKSVRNFYRRHTHRTAIRVSVLAEVTGDVAVEIHNAGLSPAEVGALVCIGLSNRART